MILEKRKKVTLLYLLRHEAAEHRRMHGEKLSERPGSMRLTPKEMEDWADEIEQTGKVQ